jgi:hypothetical protein
MRIRIQLVTFDADVDKDPTLQFILTRIRIRPFIFMRPGSELHFDVNLDPAFDLEKPDLAPFTLNRLPKMTRDRIRNTGYSTVTKKTSDSIKGTGIASSLAYVKKIL